MAYTCNVVCDFDVYSKEDIYILNSAKKNCVLLFTSLTHWMTDFLKYLNLNCFFKII